eukprot:COSAG02_NODE_856_length_16468_cov_131.787831_12_plen_53_part_00
MFINTVVLCRNSYHNFFEKWLQDSMALLMAQHGTISAVPHSIRVGLDRKSTR